MRPTPFVDSDRRPFQARSEHALSELRDALRAELMQEFRIGPQPVRTWGVFPLRPQGERASRSQDEVTYQGFWQLARVGRLVRLCIDDHDDAWTITRAQVGTNLLQLAPGLVSARAFAPLPKWITETPPELANVPEFLRAMQDFPIANVEPSPIFPGIPIEVTLLGGGNANVKRPDVWTLVELGPPSQFG